MEHELFGIDCWNYKFFLPWFSGVVGKYCLIVRSFLGFCVATAIICCWINIYRELRKLKKVHDGQDNSGAHKTWRHNTIKKKVAKMFFCVVFSLYACYIPLWVRAIAHGFNCLKSPEYEIFAVSLVFANSSINPIIYCFTSRLFRDKLFGRESESVFQWLLSMLNEDYSMLNQHYSMWTQHYNMLNQHYSMWTQHYNMLNQHYSNFI